MGSTGVCLHYNTITLTNPDNESFSLNSASNIRDSDPFKAISISRFVQFNT